MKTAQSVGLLGPIRALVLLGGIALVTMAVGCGGGGGSSSSVPENPVPQISSLSPDNANAEEAGFTLTVNGTDFVQTSSILWNDTALTTTYVSTTKLTADIPSTDLTTAGTAAVKVQNPSPGGGTSAAASFTINAPPRVAPTLVQTATHQTTSNNGELDSTVKFLAPTRPGNAIWVAVTTSDFGGIHTISVTDTQGNTFTLLDQLNDGPPGSQTVAHFYAGNIVGDRGTPDTITVHWDFDDFKGILVGEISGVTGAPLVGHGANLQDALSAGTNNITTAAIAVSAAQTPALVLALCMNTSGGDASMGGSGFGGPAAGAGFMQRSMLWDWGFNLATFETMSMTSSGNGAPLFDAPDTDDYATVAAVFH